MLGLIVLTGGNGSLGAASLFEELLGAPLLARGIAAALPSDEPVTGVLVVPAELAARAESDVVGRFALVEIERVLVAPSGMNDDLRAALRTGLEALPADVTEVLVHHAARPLVPEGLVQRVVAAARAADGAAPVTPLREAVVADDEGGLVAVDIRPRLRVLQGPQCFKRASLEAALSHDGSGESSCAELVSAAGGGVRLVPGDVDNLLLQDAADVGRAFEVFSRRAAEYPFVYPKDLLPEDPLAASVEPPAAG